MTTADQKAGYCPTIYGPKASRRQGISLGINLGDPEIKCCTWSCIYCQCGFGLKAEQPPRHPERREVLRALIEALKNHPRLDSVTFAGNSEPTAYGEFRGLVDDILRLREELKGRWVLNMLSNGSELERPEVREACDLLDEAWIKLDCADESLFARLNRPLARNNRIAEHLENIGRLRQPRIQTLLWKDLSERKLGNLTPNNQQALLEAYSVVRPVMIHLTTVQRATATAELVPASAAELEGFADEIRKAGFKVAVFP